MYRRFVRRRRFIPRKFRKSRRRRVLRRRGTNDSARFFKLRRTFIANNLSTGTSISDNPSGAQDFNSVAQLFTHYRVKAIRVQFIPNSNVNTPDPTFPFTPCYVTHIPSATTPATPSVTNLLQYENTKVKNWNRPWVYYRAMKKMIIPNSTAQLPGTWHLTATPVDTQRIYILNAPPNSPTEVGLFVVTYYITAINRA